MIWSLLMEVHSKSCTQIGIFIPFLAILPSKFAWRDYLLGFLYWIPATQTQKQIEISSPEMESRYLLYVVALRVGDAWLVGVGKRAPHGFRCPCLVSPHFSLDSLDSKLIHNFLSIEL